MGWLSGWQYRKGHEIKGSTAGAVTDYQVRVKVHYGSGTDSGEDVYLNEKCRTDFGDVRFTKDDGETLLSYWMEEEVDSDYAVFWVKVPSIPADPDTATIYIYYGNPDATTTSDIKAASLWNHGDDFDDNSRDTAIWDTLIKGSGSPNETNQRLETYCPADGDVAGYVSKDYHDGHNFEVQVLAHNTTLAEVGLFIHTTKVTDDNPYFYDDWYRVMLYNVEGKFYAQKRVSGTVTTLYSGTWAASEEKIKIRVKDSTVELYEGDTLRASDTYALGSRNIYIIVYGRGKTGYTGTDWLDNVWVRKYVDPEPSHGTWYAAEAYKELSESIATSDVIVKSVSVTRAESLSLSDVVSALRVKIKELVETIGLSDVVVKFASIVRSETIAMSDVLEKVQTLYREFVEIIGLTDRISRLISTVKSETLSLADILEKRFVILKILSETLGLSDTLARIRIKKTLARIKGVTRILKAVREKPAERELGR